MVDFGSNYVSALTNQHVNNLKFNDFNKQAGNLENMSVDEKQAAQAGKEFEALFLTQLYNFMFETVEVDSIFGGGHAEKTFRGFLVDEYGKLTAESGGIGIADNIQKMLLSMQGLEG